MPFLDRLEPVVQLFRERSRRRCMTREQGHVEFRDLVGGDRRAFAAQVEEASRELEGLDWVEVNPFLRRVIFAFRQEAPSEEELTRVVERAEALLKLVNDSDALPNTAPASPTLLNERFSNCTLEKSTPPRSTLRTRQDANSPARHSSMTCSRDW